MTDTRTFRHPPARRLLLIFVPPILATVYAAMTVDEAWARVLLATLSMLATAAVALLVRQRVVANGGTVRVQSALSSRDLSLDELDHFAWEPGRRQAVAVLKDGTTVGVPGIAPSAARRNSSSSGAAAEVHRLNEFLRR